MATNTSPAVPALRETAARAAWAPSGIEIVVALAAIYGGVGLIWNNRIGMLDEWLDGTPFHSWTVPGLLLLLVVAAPMLTAAVLELRRHRLAALVSILAGSAQVGWIAAQLLIMQRYNVQQPIMLGGGLLVVLATLWVHRSVPLAVTVRRGGGE